MASQPVWSASPRARGAEAGAQISAGAHASVGACVLAAAVPLLFLHVRYQPSVSIDVGSTTATATMSDIAVLVVALVALASGLRQGFAPLLAARWLWIAAGGLVGWIWLETLRSAGEAGFATHAVTAAKFAEYAALAVSVPLLARRPVDLRPFLWVLALWGVLAAAVALLQFVGVPIFDAWKAGWRQPSFLGHHDLAALSASGLAIGMTAIVTGGAWPADRRLAGMGLAAGIGVILSGSIAAVAGLVVAAAVAALVAHRRLGLGTRRVVALAAVVGVVAGGVIALRADPLASFLRFVGVRDDKPQAGIETYSQRTVLSYIGGRIFLDHALLGVGWQRSAEPASFEPYLADAKRKFPDVAAEAFPAPGREWGVQNSYVQAAAELGIVGLGLLLATFAAGLALAIRTARHAGIVWAGPSFMALSALLALMGVWTALGMFAGIAAEGATWLGLGVAAAAAAAFRSARA